MGSVSLGDSGGSFGSSDSDEDGGNLAGSEGVEDDEGNNAGFSSISSAKETLENSSAVGADSVPGVQSSESLGEVELGVSGTSGYCCPVSYCKSHAGGLPAANRRGRSTLGVVGAARMGDRDLLCVEMTGGTKSYVGSHSGVVNRSGTISAPGWGVGAGQSNGTEEGGRVESVTRERVAPNGGAGGGFG